MPLSSRLSVEFGGKLTNTVDLGAAEANLTKRYALTLAAGVLAGQADRIWADTRTVVPATPDDLDLAGSLLDALGGPATFARIKGLVIAAAPGNTNNVVVGAAAANPWVGLLGATHTLTLRPGAVVALMAGTADLTAYPVVAGTGDTLRIANSGAGTNVVYDVAVVGCAA